MKINHGKLILVRKKERKIIFVEKILKQKLSTNHINIDKRNSCFKIKINNYKNIRNHFISNCIQFFYKMVFIQTSYNILRGLL